MYSITDINGKFHCSVQIQDGTERWISESRQEAIYSVIRAARGLNGSYITEDNIVFYTAPTPFLATGCNPAERTLLDQIRSGEKVVLDFADLRVRMNITKKECELLQRIREGEVKLSEPF